MAFFRLFSLALAALSFLIPCAAPAQSPGSVPYEWRNVTIRGGGFVTGLLFHPHEKNLLYARTDVGGAYRSDDAGGHWIPMTDWVGGMDFTGIESFAVDPADANRIYLAAGVYSGTRAAILRSADRGRTWQQTEVPFKMGGNEAGRFNGERLAVDPHDGNILFFGSRHDGLWRSTNAGVSWTKLERFPNIDTTEEVPANAQRFRGNFRSQSIGIVFVLFDPRSGENGKPTGTIYAGVSSSGTNFFRSVDGGWNWESVPRQPVGLRPNHAVLAADGMIYLSYGKEAGPNAMTDGSVWKCEPTSDEWTEITPLKSPDGNQPFGYGAVAVDPQRPSNLVVTTFAHWRPHDEVFYSTNRGASWSPLLQDAQWDHSNAPYTAYFTPHWMGSIAIDPFDSNRVLFTTGYGIWSCDNLTETPAKPTRWEFADVGLEETVPLALISPPEGAHLLSGLGDLDGFRHVDLDTSPAAGTFNGPRFSNTEDLAFAGANPSIMVRTGTGGTDVHAAISTDGGKNWSLLPSDPRGYTRGGGNIAISADGKTIVWSERNTEPNVTSDGGAHWTACSGIVSGARVIADPVNATRFYGFDGRTGKVFASTNAAASFAETGTALGSSASDFRGPALSATPGREGDLWLNCLDCGLYHRTNGASGFAKIATVQEARAIGFGKPAEGKTFPAIYLAGRIENMEGLFRSTDIGASWVRINDDQHQYGVINHVTGDPRIFGRVYFATSGRGIIYGGPAAAHAP
jgi:photosystem II stability/assembly factor-like uncharacterized protein